MIFKIIEMYRRYEEIKKTKAEVFDLMNEFEFTKPKKERSNRKSGKSPEKLQLYCMRNE